MGEIVPELAKAIGASMLPSVGLLLNATLFPGFHDSADCWDRYLNWLLTESPDWIFDAVGTAMYTGIGYASYLVWRDGGGFHGQAKNALIAYGVQLALNWAWTPIYCGANKRGLAVVDAICFTAVAVVTAVRFLRINTTAYLLMMPYLGWLSFCLSPNVVFWLGGLLEQEQERRESRNFFRRAKSGG